MLRTGQLQLNSKRPIDLSAHLWIKVYTWTCQNGSYLNPTPNKTRGPQALMFTWVSGTLHWLLVRRDHIYFIYQWWGRKAAYSSLNTIAINILMCCILIDKTYSLLWLISTPYHQSLCPSGHEIYSFGRPFLGHHYYIINAWDFRRYWKKCIFTKWHMATRTPGFIKFTMWIDPSLVLITIYLDCLIRAPE